MSAPTPDQPTGMNELRAAIAKKFEEDGGYAALMHLHRQDYDKKNCFCTTDVSGAYNKVLDVIEAICHNLQQAGLLRGEEGQPIPQSEIDAELRASSNIEDMFNNGELR